MQPDEEMIVRHYYRTKITEDSPAGVYIELLHGRRNPKEQLDDWGFDGGFIGPIDWYHTTYVGMVRIGTPETPDGFELDLSTGMLEFDGYYYGDWTVCFHQPCRNVLSYLAVPWVHLRYDTRDALQGSDPPTLVYRSPDYDDDVFIYVLSDEALRLAVHSGAGIPGDLQHLMHVARNRGCRFLHLHSDAPRLRGWPVY